MEDIKQECIAIIKKHTGKKHVRIVDRGNSAIMLSLVVAKSLGYKKVMVADEGRWLTHPQYPEKLGMEVIELKTDDALLDPKTLVKDAVLIYNCMGGYFVEEPVEEIYKEAKKKNVFVINDTSVLPDKKLTSNADIIIGSFGRWKVVDNHYGGFVAADNEGWLHADIGKDIEPREMDWKTFSEKLKEADNRLKWLYKECKRLKEGLKGHDVAYRDSNSLVVVVRYKDENEKQEIIEYAAKEGYEITECPREIRINSNAISIEVKRR